MQLSRTLVTNLELFKGKSDAAFSIDASAEVDALAGLSDNSNL